MKAFAHFTITACVALLSWWQLDLYIGLGVVAIAMIGAGATAAILSWQRMRTGYGLAVVVGLAYLAEVAWLAPKGGLSPLQPLVAWSMGLMVSSGWLLWERREKSPKRPEYERHPEY